MILNWIIDVGPGDTGQTMRIANASDREGEMEPWREYVTGNRTNCNCGARIGSPHQPGCSADESDYTAAVEALEEFKKDPMSGISIAELKAKVGRS